MRAKKPREMEADLDMTTFINLMVVLLAFLLVSAVFTEVTRLDVNLPAPGDGQSTDNNKPPLVLEVSFYKDHILVANQTTGPLKEFPALPGGVLDYKGLKAYLIELKDEYPSVTEVSVMLEPDTPYEVLISGMDAVRYKPKMVNGKQIKAALFPDISIGDAVPASSSAPAAPAAGGAE
ncbi:MAG: ExbD/TolR family protein [Pseudomonadota bacterium]